MRVLIVTPEYPPHAGGGILRYYRALAPALARHGCAVTVLVSAPSSPDFAAYEQDGVRVVCASRADSHARANGLAQFSAAPEFRHWLAGALVAGETARRLGEWDAIETVDFGLTFAPFVLNDFGAPVVVQLHGSLGQIAEHEPVRADHLLDSTLARLAEFALLTLTSELQTYASANAAEWESRLDTSVVALAPPVDSIDELTSAPASGEALVVGRVQSWKGPAVLCESLRELPETFPRVRWAGRDTATAPDGGSLSSHLAASYPDVWGRRIVPIGQRPFDEVQTLMAAARMVIVPSNWDVFNLAAIEAMSAGRVVVCSSAAGASDLIASGRNGFVFRAGDSGALAAALRDAAELSDDARARMGAAARDTVVLRLNPDTVAAERVSRYRALKEASHRPAAPPDWLREVFGGSAALPVGPEFLDQMNVRDLSKYLGKRLRTRLIERVSGGG